MLVLKKEVKSDFITAKPVDQHATALSPASQIRRPIAEGVTEANWDAKDKGPTETNVDETV